MTIQSVKAEMETAIKPVAKLLRKSQDSKILVIGLRKDLVLKAHSTPVRTLLTVLEGSVEYHEEGKSIVLNQYEEHEIPIKIIHSLVALDDSLCLLIQG